MPDTLRKAMKYRLYPTKAQAAKMAWTLETCRHVYNSRVNDRKWPVRGQRQGFDVAGTEAGDHPGPCFAPS